MEKHTHAPKAEVDSGLAVHQVLAVSYAVYLAAVFVGFILEIFWDIKFTSPLFVPIGFVCIMLGTFLAFWAQYSSGRTAKSRGEKDSVTHSSFLVGPYHFTRSPTQYGLLLMTLGLSFIYNSMIMVITTIIAFLLGKFVFIPMEERHLAKKYGQSYEDYKKKVLF